MTTERGHLRSVDDDGRISGKPWVVAARAERAMQRATALTVPCPVLYCGAPVGVECLTPAGDPLEMQAAHYRRLQDSGVL